MPKRATPLMLLLLLLAAAGCVGKAASQGEAGRGDPSGLLYGQEMIGNVTNDSADIRLVAGKACTPSVQFRVLHDVTSRADPSAYAFRTSAVGGFTENDPIAFTLAGLPESSRIHYRIGFNRGGGWVYRDEHSFHTKRSAGEPFRFCLVADNHVFPPGYRYRHNLRQVTYANVLADNPDLLIMLGDEFSLGLQGSRAYHWSPRQRKIVPDTLRILRSISDLACHSMSCLFVNGNHEGLFGWTIDTPQYQFILEGKQAYFPVPNSGTFPEGGDDNARYGAFTWGDVLFVWLDVVGFSPTNPRAGTEPHYVLGDAQRKFLKTTLANSSARWKFVLAHHLFGGNEDCPRGMFGGGKGMYGRGNASGAHRYDQAQVQDLMVKHGAQAFFYGHDHVFSVSEADGVAYVCSGNPGSGTWGARWLEAQRACYEPYLLFPTENGRVPSGHVRVDVTRQKVTISYIRASEESDNRAVVAVHVLQ